MPTFFYKAKDKQGKNHEGQMKIATRDKLIRKLKDQGLTPIDIVEGVAAATTEIKPEEALKTAKKRTQKKPEKKKAKAPAPALFSFGVSDEELAFFTRQMATIMNAGLPLDRIISILYKQTKNPRMKNAIHQIGTDIQKGSSVTDALAKHKDIFDNMFLSMIGVGEVSGNMPEVVDRLANLIEKNLAVKKKIKAALAYPVFILIFSAILSYVLIAVFLPGFIPMFKGVGLNIQQDYPLTHYLIQMSNLATNPTAVAGGIAFLIIAAIGIKMAFNTEPGRMFFDNLAFTVPGLSGLVKQAALARFCRSYANLSSSGVPVLQSLSLVAGASGNVVVSKAVERISSSIKQGESLSETMGKESLFPDMVIQMVTVGEEAGTVPEMFERTADYLDQGLDNTVSSLTSLLEPAMMVFVGLVVGVFVMGILLPILGITSKLGA